MTTNSLWPNKIEAARKYHIDWEDKFKCQTLEDYYEGFQWKKKHETASFNSNPYTINLFYSTIKIKLATLLFQKPTYILAPRPGTISQTWDLDKAVQSSGMKQDVLNTIIQNPSISFINHVKLAAIDSFFRFGLVEVGYAADWRNPGKEDPLLKSHDDNTVSEMKDRVVEDNEIPINERFYVKRIPPKRFICAVSEATELHDHEWFGYYEFFHTKQLKKTKGIKWPNDALQEYISADASSVFTPELVSDDLQKQYTLHNVGVSKVWHIWDLVAHKRFLFLDSFYEEPLWTGEFERHPFVDLRWDYRTSGFYPLPPCFQWLSPQDEINEAREQTRSYRRRFTRKFQAIKGQVEPEEVDKFVSGPDGEVTWVNQINAISPIQNPEQGQTADKALIIAKDDFNIISGTSAEARGQNADRETATQARIVDSRAQLRENADQLDFSTFMCKIGREILAQAKEKLTEGLWVKYTSNPSEGILQNMDTNPIYQYIRGQDLDDDYDFEIDIDIQNATPAAMQQAQQSFITFLTLIQKFPMMATSPVLIREAAFRCGYKNEKVIQQIQQTAVMALQAQAIQAAGQQGISPGEIANNAGNAAKTQLAQQQPNTVDQIGTQLDNQMGGIQ